ncbi:FkbM family methyltransferase [Mesorhizobium sp. INR15]|uniref:FkbM family methyltransferase n=1 Tax=Mesorhizobium sp. INR15 TaxID=2654248 RepID=UPI00189698A6|nr:FkbM family methyltransferase [Mesorhizobium sp. INR15]
MRNPFAWMKHGLRRLRPPRRRAITLDGLPPFRFETHGRADVHISGSIDHWGIWEKATTGLLLELLRNDADLIDVGANIGWHSVVAGHRLGDRGQVHCFEPEQRNLKKLRTNVALSRLGNVVVNGWALSDSNRVDALNLSDHNLGDHRLGLSRDGRSAVKVEVRCLDDYAGIRRRPLVIKLDVQGSEWHALRGGQRLLGDHPHEIVLVCELCPLMLRECGASIDDLCELLIANGFAAALIDQSTGSIEPTDWGPLKDRLRAGERDAPEFSEDIVAFRRPDGLMGSLLQLQG